MRFLCLGVLTSPFIFILGGCGSSSSSSSRGQPDIRLSLNTPLPVISSLNIMAYPLNGICKFGEGNVIVTVTEEELINSENFSDKQVSENSSKEGEETTELPPIVEEDLPNGTFACDENGKFSGMMDLSDIDSEDKFLKIKITQGLNTTIVAQSDIPINDQTGLASAPTATTPSGSVGGPGLSFSLEVACSEAQEQVSFSGSGLDPDPQIFICAAAGTESFNLKLTSGIELVSPNNLTITSTDEHGNSSSASTTVNVPMDTKGPIVVVSNEGDIIVGQRASFAITITDENPASSISYEVSVSGGETATYTCTVNPCEITTAVISSLGDVNLTVSANSVADDLGNMGDVTDQISTVTTIQPIVTSLQLFKSYENKPSDAIILNEIFQPSNGNGATYTVSVPRHVDQIIIQATSENPTATINIEGGKNLGTLGEAEWHLMASGQDTEIVVNAADEEGSYTETITVIVSREFFPKIKNITVTSTPLSSDTYGSGEDIYVTVSFSEVVSVDTTDGTPFFEIQLENNDVRRASYSSGSMTRELVFRYGVKAKDQDSDGIWIGGVNSSIEPGRRLFLNGGSITDLSGMVGALLDHNEIGVLGAHKVNGGSTGAFSNAKLRHLSLTDGAGNLISFDQDFNPSLKDYTVTIFHEVSLLDLDFDVRTFDGNAQWVIDSESSDGGIVTFTVTVTAENGVNTNDYTIIVTLPEAPADNEATLAKLALEYENGQSVEFTEAFSSGTTGYTAYIPASISQLKVKVLKTSSHAMVVIAGDDNVVTPFEANISLPFDGDHTVAVAVTAEDGVTVQEYTVDLVRLKPITITRKHDSVMGDFEEPTFKLNRQGDLTQALDVTIRIHQDENWLSTTTYTKSFGAEEGSIDVELDEISSGNIARLDGHIYVTIDSIEGYDTSNVEAIRVISIPESDLPHLMTVKLEHEEYYFNENDRVALVHLIVEAQTPHIHRIPSEYISISTKSGTAKSPQDYPATSLQTSMSNIDHDKYVKRDETTGLLVARIPVYYEIYNDIIFEGEEIFEVALENSPGLSPRVDLVFPKRPQIYLADDATTDTLEETPVSCFTSTSREITGYQDQDTDGNSCPSEFVLTDNFYRTISDNAFESKGLTIVLMTIGMEVIGVSAFASNSLTQVFLPPSIEEVKAGAFSGNTDLKPVHIYDKDAIIAEDAFPNGYVQARQGTPLNCFVFDSEDPTLITGYLENTGKIQLFYIFEKCPKDVVIPKGTVSIGEEAFLSQGLTSVDFPESLEFIGDRAFADNKLTSDTLPDGVTAGQNIFSGNPVTVD